MIKSYLLKLEGKAPASQQASSISRDLKTIFLRCSGERKIQGIVPIKLERLQQHHLLPILNF